MPYGNVQHHVWVQEDEIPCQPEPAAYVDGPEHHQIDEQQEPSARRHGGLWVALKLHDDLRFQNLAIEELGQSDESDLPGQQNSVLVELRGRG